MPKIPGISHQGAVRALRKAGFEIKRQGKHIVMSDGTHTDRGDKIRPISAREMTRREIRDYEQI